MKVKMQLKSKTFRSGDSFNQLMAYKTKTASFALRTFTAEQSKQDPLNLRQLGLITLKRIFYRIYTISTQCPMLAFTRTLNPV